MKLIFLLILAFISSCGIDEETQPSRIKAATTSTQLPFDTNKNDDLVGRVPYIASVNKFGQSTIEVPLKQLTAGNSFSPQISLQYYSANQSIGELGYGWMISGLSKIHRCPSQKYYDGKNGPVSYSNSGNFCLNGKRLVATEDSPSFGNQVYRPASDDFTKVEFNGTYFKAFKKNGDIETYGITSKGRELGKGRAVFSWHIESVIDRKGNSITYDYLLEDNRLYLSKVSYGGNIDSNIDSYRFIEFAHESSRNTTSSYVTGQKSVTKKRVSSITMKDIDGEAWKYKLIYRNMGLGRGEYLRGISLCIGKVCTPSTEFKYQTSNLSLTPKAKVKTFGMSDPNQTPKMVRSIVDYNNDGWDDIVTLNRTQLSVENGSPSGFSSPVVISNGLPPTWLFQKDPVYIRDINADGWIDILTTITTTSSQVPPSETGIYVFYGRKNGFDQAIQVANLLGDINPRSEYMSLSDLNGDNKPEVVVFRTNGVYVLKNNGTSFSKATSDGYVTKEFSYAKGWDNGRSFRNVLDIDGDGKQDLVGLKYGGIWVSRGDGYKFSTPTNWGAASRPASYNILDDKRTFADVNGDSLLDVVGFRSGGVFVRLNNGSSFEQEQLWLNDFSSSNGWRERASSRFLIDINLDGFQDFVGIRKGLIRVYLGHGRAFTSTEQSSNVINLTHEEISRWQKRYPLFQQDLDADGSAELSILNIFNGLQAYENKSKPIRLNSISDAFGRKTVLAYAPGRQGKLYKKKLDLNYPLQSIPHGGYLVSSLQESDGLGGMKRIEYSYEDAMLHKDGLGFIGFRKWITEDITSNTKREVTYSLDYKNFKSGLPVSSVEYWKKSGEYKKVKAHETTWQFKSLSSHNKHVFVYPYKTTLETFDETKQSLSVTSTKNFYDNYGNQTKSIATSSDDFFETTVTTTNLYEADNVDDWILGKVTATSVEYVKDGFPTLTNNASFEYDSQGLLVSEVREPGSNFETTVTYSRYGNSFGHINSEVRTWSDELGGGLSFSSTEKKRGFDRYGFLEWSENEVNHRETVLKRQPIYRKVVKSSDLNGLQSSLEYSLDGKVSKTVQADGHVITEKSYWCRDNCPYLGVYYIKSSSSSGSEVTTYKDRFDRDIRIKTKALDSKYKCSDLQYNSKGLINRKSLTYFCHNRPAYWTTLEYDEQNRLISEIYADNTKKTITRSRNKTTVTDRRGLKEVTTISPFGLVQSVSNHKGETLYYEYDAKGRLVKTTDAAGNEYVSKWNLLSQQISLEDPNLGIKSFSYNGIGLLYRETDAEGISARHSYDELGRLIRLGYYKNDRLEYENTWVFDTKPNGIGAIDYKRNENKKEEYFYDSLSRVSKVKETIKDQVLEYKTAYDSISRPNRITLPSGFEYKLSYTKEGIQDKITSVDGTKIYSEILEESEYGLSKVRQGKYATTDYTYNPKTGRLTQIQVKNGSSTLDNRSFDYDNNGNLKSRSDIKRNIKESFQYDDLNRLKKVFKNDVLQRSINYDEQGNIISRSDISGSFEYGNRCNAGPHAVTKANGRSYCYNAVGQMVKSGDRDIKYSPNGKPSYIGNSSKSIELYYGPDSEMVRQAINSRSRLEEEIFYSTGSELRLKNGKKTWKHYIGSDVLIKVEGGTIEESYLHLDHLGSTVAVSNSAGQLTESLSYNAWGQRRDHSTYRLLLGEKPKSTDHGFTGHVHLDDLDLIHMQGRVYDPTIGRFLSPDPFVQSPFNLQSYNRYSYLWNNPLSGTDPTGYFSIGDVFKGLGKLLSNPARVISKALTRAQKWVRRPENQRLVASIAIQAATAYYAPVLSSYFGEAWVSWATVGAGGYTSGYVSSNGNHDYARTAMLQSLVTAGIGDFVPDSGKAIAHGLSGGAFSTANGGDFQSGFISAAASASFYQSGAEGLAASLGVDANSGVFKALTSTAIGGLSSELTGGNFESGALTASFTSMFNHLLHETESGCIVVDRPHTDTVDGGFIFDQGPTLQNDPNVKFARELASVYSAPYEFAYEAYSAGKSTGRYLLKTVGGNSKPYQKSRPSYGKNQVEQVWKNAKQPDGNVYDPNTGELLKWDRSKSRAGQWDMGHTAGNEYRKLHSDYLDGKVSKKQFLEIYRDPRKYQPESPSANRSHRYEK